VILSLLSSWLKQVFLLCITILAQGSTLTILDFSLSLWIIAMIFLLELVETTCILDGLNYLFWVANVYVLCHQFSHCCYEHGHQKYLG